MDHCQASPRRGVEQPAEPPHCPCRDGSSGHFPEGALLRLGHCHWGPSMGGEALQGPGPRLEPAPGRWEGPHTGRCASQPPRALRPWLGGPQAIRPPVTLAFSNVPPHKEPGMMLGPQEPGRGPRLTCFLIPLKAPHQLP